MRSDARPGRPLRVLWLIDSLTSGGAESLTATFADAAAPAGLELEVCALKSLGGNPVEERLRADGIRVRVVGSAGLRDARAFRRLLADLRRDPPDVLHAHLTDATIWADRLARSLGRPWAATLHVLPGAGGVAGWRGAVRRRLELAALRRATAVVAVSQAVAASWAAAGLPPERFEVIPNGVDVEALGAPAGDPAVRAAVRRELGVDETSPLLVTVSVLRRGKGVETLLAAFERLLARRPGVRLAIVGDGPEGERLRRIAEPLGDRVSWLGYRPSVAPFLAAADLFVLASRGDAYPTVLLEAAAAGLPVIATRGGGVPEIVTDGESGLLVPPGDAGRLAATIEDLLSDPPRAAAMAGAARRRAASDFSAARWAERLAGLYRRLVAGGGAGSGVRPLRVAVVEPAARGGMIHYAYQLCRGLKLAGAEPTLITARGYELADLPHPFRRIELLRLWDPKPVGEQSAAPPSPWRRLGRGFVWYREWLRLVSWLVRERPDVVQLGDLRFAGDLLPVALLRLSGLPLVDVCHNVEPFSLGGRRAGRFGAGALTRWLYRRIYRRFDRVVVHFAANRTAFLQATGLPPGRVAVIAFGNQELFAELADPGVTPAVLRRRLELGEGTPVVLVFGTLAPYKGIDLAIEAFAEVSRAEPAARLVIAGYPLAGFDVAAHRRLADDRGVGHRVCFVPAYLPATEVVAWMALAAVVLVPHRQAFQSGVLSLAQTFGRPLVATRVGAMAEAVENGRTGVLVPSDEPPAMAAAVTALLADPEGAARLGQAAAAEARERCAWRLVAEDLLVVHHEAIRSRGGER